MCPGDIWAQRLHTQWLLRHRHANKLENYRLDCPLMPMCNSDLCCISLQMTQIAQIVWGCFAWGHSIAWWTASRSQGSLMRMALGNMQASSNGQCTLAIMQPASGNMQTFSTWRAFAPETSAVVHASNCLLALLHALSRMRGDGQIETLIHAAEMPSHF